MNRKDKLRFLILFFIIASIIFGKGTYKPKSFSSTLIFGHDSNPLRLSQSEIDELSDRITSIEKHKTETESSNRGLLPPIRQENFSDRWIKKKEKF